MRGSSANIASALHTSLDRVTSTNSPGHTVVLVGVARGKWARLVAQGESRRDCSLADNDQW